MLTAELALISVAGPSALHARWRAEAGRAELDAARDDLYLRYWLDAARVLGADTAGEGTGPLDITLGERRTTVWDSFVELDDPVSLRLALRKPTAKARLSAFGVPTPEQIQCSQRDLGQAVRFLDRVGRCTVKPGGAGRGFGVTCGVSSPHEMAIAIAFALRWDDGVVVERHVDGSEYRLLVLDGEVISAIRRLPPTVMGDGSTGIGRLIGVENAHRADAPGLNGLYPISIDLDLVLTLKRAGLSLRSVPGLGQRVVVKTAVNENGPVGNELVEPTVALQNAAVAAAKALHLRYAAVEILTPDSSRALASVGGAVVEVNATPGLHYHYQVRNPLEDARVAVATIVLRRLLDAEPSTGRAMRGHSP